MMYPYNLPTKRSVTEYVPPWGVREARSIVEIRETSLLRYHPLADNYVEYVVSSYKARKGTTEEHPGKVEEKTETQASLYPFTGLRTWFSQNPRDTKDNGYNGVITLKNITYRNEIGEDNPSLSFYDDGHDTSRLVFADSLQNPTQMFQREGTRENRQFVSGILLHMALALVLVILNNRDVRRAIGLPGVISK